MKVKKSISTVVSYILTDDQGREYWGTYVDPDPRVADDNAFWSALKKARQDGHFPLNNEEQEDE